jgi:hypothetical protein
MSYIVRSHGRKKDSQISPYGLPKQLPSKLIGEFNSLQKAKAACRNHRTQAWKGKEKLTFRKWAWGRNYESNAYEYRGAIFYFTIKRK